MRTDDGTENSLVEALHTYLMHSTSNDNTDLCCFAIGRSTANQRIEAYWSQLVMALAGGLTFSKIFVT